MASLIPGYGYDIFISYRHNDNRSGWVTEFVKNLQEELSATIKEPVSVYFDSNPHDGLLETHNVDKSLEGKLKCLIFIPILSQTYCDPKSFAWQHEFLRFNQITKEDLFGRDIKLGNGNVASRILPVRIHDLDPEDKSLIEKELEGPLRPIDFIYKSAGVNRSLKPNDERAENINHTFYRDQINKVANVVKEIIASMKHPPIAPAAHQRSSLASVDPPINRRTRKRLSWFGALAIILGIVAYFFIPSLIPPEMVYDKSIAVLPFENLSGDPGQEYFSDGIAEEILNALAQVSDLKVPGRTSSFQFKGKSVDLREVGAKLGVSTVLEGSVRRQGNKVRITAQLISVKDGYHLWSQQFDRTMDDVFTIQEEIARTITQRLKVTLLSNENLQVGEDLTENKEAYDSYLKGRFFWNRRELKESEQYFKEAIKRDPSFEAAYAGLAETYVVFPFYNAGAPHECMPKAQEAAEKAIQLNSTLSAPYAVIGYKNFIYDWKMDIAERYFEKSLNLNPKYAPAHYWYGQYLSAYGHSEKAEAEMRKAVALDPLGSFAHFSLALALMGANRLNESIEASKSAIEFNNQFSPAYLIMAYCYMRLDKEAEAFQQFKKAAQLSNDRGQAWMIYFNVKSGDLDQASAAYNALLSRAKTEYVAKSDQALAATFLGKKDTAHALLREAFDERDPYLSGLLLFSLPLHDDIFSDPRNVQLFKQFGLPVR